jgi:CHAD domain-containing protein
MKVPALEALKMAFRVRRGESIAHGLRRLARKELASAREQLQRTTPPDDDAIHEARKSMKKVRAIVHLVETDRGRGLADNKKRLRAVSRTLSQSRDADAMTVILQKLVDQRPHVLSEHTLARVRHQLSDHKNAVARATARDGSWKEVANELRTVRAAVKRWSPAHKRFGALAPGLRKTHKRGRKAMTRALQRHRATDFHEWRKQIKALWYELRLIEDSAPRIHRDAEVLNHAETWLGDDHNVVVLCAYLSSNQSSWHDSNEFQRMMRVGDRYQQELRRKAIASTKAIYGVPTSVYVRRVKSDWRHRDAQNRSARSPHRTPRRAS